jgi:hypothetical protein
MQVTAKLTFPSFSSQNEELLSLYLFAINISFQVSECDGRIQRIVYLYTYCDMTLESRNRCSLLGNDSVNTF